MPGVRSTRFEPLTVSGNVIRGVKVCGLTSANRRRYKPEALRRAVRAGLYEGAVVQVDHHGHADRFGTLINTRYRPGRGVFADLKYDPRHPLAECVAEDAKRGLGIYGLSHDADGIGRRANVVEGIAAVRHVAIVAGAATTMALSEAREYWGARRLRNNKKGENEVYDDMDDDLEEDDYEDDEMEEDDDCEEDDEEYDELDEDEDMDDEDEDFEEARPVRRRKKSRESVGRSVSDGVAFLAGGGIESAYRVAALEVMLGGLTRRRPAKEPRERVPKKFRNSTHLAEWLTGCPVEESTRSGRPADPGVPAPGEDVAGFLMG